MADLGVAFTWLAISAASIKGLAALARTSARGELEEELISPGIELFSATSAVGDGAHLDALADLGMQRIGAESVLSG